MAKIKLQLPKNCNVADGWLLMTSEDLHELISSLRASGMIREKNPEPVNAQHLEDMRRIAFSQLSIDHKQGITAVKDGANLILSALRRGGQIASEHIDDDSDEPTAKNFDDGIGVAEEGENDIPPVIIARSEKMAEQYGLASVDDFLTKGAVDALKEDDEI